MRGFFTLIEFGDTWYRQENAFLLLIGKSTEGLPSFYSSWLDYIFHVTLREFHPSHMILHTFHTLS
jgi:hypothetical protein